MATTVLCDAWAAAMWRACWQGGIVVLVVWTVCRWLPSMPARCQCWFWRLAILKFILVLVVPWLLNVPLLPAPSAAIPVPEVTFHAAMDLPMVAADIRPTGPMDRLDHRQSKTTDPSKAMEWPSLPTTLGVAWILGVGWCLARLLVAFRQAMRLRKRSHGIACAPLMEQLAIQGRLFGLRNPPRLFEVDGGGSPMLIGVFRPAIVIPTETLGRLSVSERTMVLGHELAHIRRGDLFWGLIASVVRAVFFFHPLVWWSERRLKLIQEIAADELVIARQHHEPVDYASLLVSVVCKLGRRPLVSAISVETVGTMHSLARRLVAMMRTSRASRRVVVGSAILLTATVLLGVVPWRLVAAEAQEKASPPSRFVVEEKQAFEQGKAVAAIIAKLGGQVIVGEESAVVGVDLHGTKVTDADLEHFKGFPNLQALFLDHTNITDAGLKHLEGLTELAWLGVAETKVTDAGLRQFTQLERLVRLNLGGSNVTAEMLQRLGKLFRLQELSLEGPEITDRAFEHLKALNGLQHLHLLDTKITDAGLANLKTLPRLGALHLRGATFTDAGLQHLQGCTQLQLLHLEGAKATDEGVAKLRQALPECSIYLTRRVSSAGTAEADSARAQTIAAIEQLGGDVTLDAKSPDKPVIGVNLQGSDVTDADLERLKGLSQLQTLNLWQTKVTDAGLVYLKGLTKLQKLDLQASDVTDAGLEHLKGLTELQSLNLWRTKVTGVGLVYLKGMTKLQTLGMSEIKVMTDAGLEHLEGLTQLKHLSLGCTKVTDAGLEHLKGLTQLETLSLGYTQVTDAGLKHLKGLTKLQMLDLMSLRVTDAGLEHLKGLTQLQSLSLANTQVTDAGLERLNGLTQLQSLQLCKTKVTDAGLEHLKGLTQLQTLYLGDTQVTDAGLVHLKGLTKLEILGLDDAKIADAGLVHLESLANLQFLNLAGTQVTDAGLVHLKKLTKLQQLYLERTQVTDAGLEHLKGLTQLRIVDLSDAKVTDEGVKKLQRSLPNCEMPKPVR